MGYFPATIAAALQGKVVRKARLVELQFSPTPAYFWEGRGPLTTGGHTYIGLHQLGPIEGLQEALNGESVQMRLTLSAADLTSDIVQTAANEDRAGYVNRLVRIWLQFFGPDWELLDPPYALAAGLMDGIEISREQGANGSTVRSITVTAENIFKNRRVAPNGYYTDSDQKQRYPGDRGLEFIPGLQDKTIAVPW